MVFTLEWAQAITPEMTSSLWAERHVKGRWGDNHGQSHIRSSLLFYSWWMYNTNGLILW